MNEIREEVRKAKGQVLPASVLKCALRKARLQKERAAQRDEKGRGHGACWISPKMENGMPLLPLIFFLFWEILLKSIL